MFCPQCGSEYREEFTTCSDCRVSLVDQRPPEPRFTKLVTVLETSDHALLIVAKSILDGAAIPYSAIGERAQDLFGLGRLGSGFNVAVGAVQIRVPEEYKDDALALLAEANDEGSGDA